eukprot:4325362-Prymnesium_polylepis.2
MPIARQVGLQPLRARRQEVSHQLTLSRRVDRTTKVGVGRSPYIPQQHPHERAAASAAAQPLRRRPQRTQCLLHAADTPRRLVHHGLREASAKARHRRKPPHEGTKGNRLGVAQLTSAVVGRRHEEVLDERPHHQLAQVGPHHQRAVLHRRKVDRPRRVVRVKQHVAAV